MQFGVCCAPEDAAPIAAAGFAFIEIHVQTHLKSMEDDASFDAYLPRLRGARPPCLAANCFVPPSLKITGPDADPARLAAYAATALTRARRAGLKTIVFGSGGARRVPEGFPRAAAWTQLLEFGAMVAALAAREGVTIVVEPLNRAECNILTGVGETAGYVREVNHPSFCLLVDAYHWMKDDDSYEDLLAAGPLLRHVHIATRASRLAPGGEPCDFSRFFGALHQARYQGPVSIECSSVDFASRAADYLAELQKLAATPEIRA